MLSGDLQQFELDFSRENSPGRIGWAVHHNDFSLSVYKASQRVKIWQESFPLQQWVSPGDPVIHSNDHFVVGPTKIRNKYLFA